MTNEEMNELTKSLISKLKEHAIKNNPASLPQNAGSVSIDGLRSMTTDYNNFENTFNSVVNALQVLLSVGATLYANPYFPIQYPIDWPTFQTYLINAATAINNFTSTFPERPPLTQ